MDAAKLEAVIEACDELIEEMTVLLSEEEIDIALMRNCSDGYGGVAQAQLKKVVEWGDEDCDGDDTHWGTIYSPLKPKRQCPQCWQALKEEAGIIKVEA